MTPMVPICLASPPDMHDTKMQAMPSLEKLTDQLHGLEQQAQAVAVAATYTTTVAPGCVRAVF